MRSCCEAWCELLDGSAGGPAAAPEPPSEGGLAEGSAGGPGADPAPVRERGRLVGGIPMDSRKVFTWRSAAQYKRVLEYVSRYGIR